MNLMHTFNSVGQNASQKAQELACNFNLPVLNVTQENISINNTENKAVPMFFLRPVSTNEVQEIISSMPSNKSPGYDKVSMKVIKDCLPHVVQTLTNIINESLRTGEFPRCRKTAEIIPHLKEGDHEVPENNRPISLLPALSKVIERIIHNQLMSYLNCYSKLSEHQSGNRKYHSTETLGIFFSNELFKAIDQKEVTAAILLDLSKAFDSLNHEILLRKLAKLGVSTDALKWFRSYLAERVQRVRIHDSVSSPLTISHGVLQGSILGPLLFTLYVNDLPTACTTCKVNSFVDDSKMFLSFSAKDTNHNLELVKTDLLRIASWCCTNHLLLNPDKTKLAMFGTHQMLKCVAPQSIMFLGNELKISDSVKHLGIILDSQLFFNDHIDYLVASLMSKLCSINRINHLLDHKTIITVIHSLVFSKLYYCSCV